MSRSKAPGSRTTRIQWLSRLAIAAALLVGGYVLFTRMGRSVSGTFTPYRSAPGTFAGFPPAPSRKGMAPPMPGGRSGGPFPLPVNGPHPGSPIVHTFKIVELNSASLAELETLPGITPDYARKILAGRPYRAMSELEKAGIPHAIVAEISPPAIIRFEESKPNPNPKP
jgi:hypothetical protein